MLKLKLKQEIVKPENFIEVLDIDLFGLFEKIEVAPGRNEKKRLLGHCNEKQLALIELALNPFKQFHITKWSNITSQIEFPDDTSAYNSFVELVNYAQGTNRCSELEQRVGSFFARCNNQQTKWFGRIITKDLRIGVLAKTVNDVFPDTVPEFNIMLAQKAETISEKSVLVNIEDINFAKGVWAEIKYDGFRSVHIHNLDTSDILGRSGKEVINQEFYEKSLKFNNELCGFFLDGEAWCPGLTFEEISSIMRTENKPLPKDFKFLLFDTCKVSEWQNEYSKTFLERRLERKETAKIYPEFYQEAEGKEVHTVQEIIDYYNEARERGFEGLILKYLDGRYENKRSKNLLKVKPEDTIDAQIIDVFEGTGKFVGQLGGFIVKIEGFDEDVRVGGGFKDWQRTKYWNERNSLVGKWIKIEFTERTQAGSLRHPRFKGFKTDRE